MEAVIRFSHESMARGSPSFAAASRLFPAQVRDSAAMLYAACRYCDDLIDGQEFGFQPTTPVPEHPGERLQHLERETRRALAGQPSPEPVFQALHHVVVRHRIPEAYVLDFLQGFRMDVEGRTYACFEDTLGYAYHVAGVVGVMMAMVMGVRDRDTLDHACDLGIAFQLTNIARDIVDDAAMGRCYLPEDWLREHALNAGSLANPEHRQTLSRIGTRLVDRAEPYYRSALLGLPRLGWRNAWAIAAAAAIYRDIGIKVRDRGATAWDQRVMTSRGRKLALAAVGSLHAVRAVLGKKGLDNGGGARVGLWTRPYPESE